MIGIIYSGADKKNNLYLSLTDI